MTAEIIRRDGAKALEQGLEIHKIVVELLCNLYNALVGVRQTVLRQNHLSLPDEGEKPLPAHLPKDPVERRFRPM